MATQMFTTRPEIAGTFGVVTSTHWLGTAVGMAVLERGGNAFDAAVAAGFTLQFAEPHLNGPGGELPAIFWSAKERRVRVLCAQGTAPAAASIAAFRDLGLDLIPGSGLLPAVVPGAFDGWLTLLRDYGTLRLRDVLDTALGYAEHGIPVLPRINETIATVERLFNEQWPSSAEIFLQRGRAPEIGSWMQNRRAAATYRRILEDAEAAGGGREAEIETARAAWYTGWVAAAIDEFYRNERLLDASGRRHGGLLTGDDLARWRATYEDPATIDFGPCTVCKCGFWSQGPVTLQTLGLLREMGLDEMAPASAEFVHTVCEALKLSFADREAWYGDPEFADVPSKALLSDDYLADRRRLIGRDASDALQPGTPDGMAPDVSAALAFADSQMDGNDGGGYWSIGEPTVAPSGEVRGDTVHLDVIDRHGNMISVTPSGGWLQSAPAIPELGFPLGVRGQMFWLDESSRSALAPGKRPRTTLSPALALRDGEPYMVWGTPGGDQQDQWGTLLFLHHVALGMNLQEAIDAPAFHSEHFPSSFWPRLRSPRRLVLEGRFDPAVVGDLEARGHDVVVGGDWSEGRLTAASKVGEVIKAAANPRGMQGYAAGR